MFEFTSDELYGKSISIVGPGIQPMVTDQLAKGYFENALLQFVTRSKINIVVNCSGFYLGLISDINGYIVLTVKFSDDHVLQKELIRKTQELDSFIYRTAHDLRGPLATVKGLINLLKMRDDDSEVDEFIRLIDVHAEKLDDRLHKLVYLSETHEKAVPSKGLLNLDSLSDTLRETVKNNYSGVELSISIAAQEEIRGVNESLITSMTNNLLLYVLSLPVEMECSIRICFSVNAGLLKVEVDGLGFYASEQVRKGIRQSSFVYNDMMSYPLLVNYYAAQKLAIQLSAIIEVEFRTSFDQHIQVSVPLQISPSN